MLKHLRKPWLLVLAMNFLLLQVTDQLNHWTSAGHLYLQAYWILPIYPALYFSFTRGFLVTFASALLAESYTGFPHGTILVLLLFLHLGLFLFRKHLQTLEQIPHPLIALLTVALGFFALLFCTPLALLFQPAFWFRFTADLGYNLVFFTAFSIIFYRTQRHFLRCCDFK